MPFIDHNPRGGGKIEFDPAQKQRYKERSQAERANARLKDEFGGRQIWVRGHTKVMSHLMFGVLRLTANQSLRLLMSCGKRHRDVGGAATAVPEEISS